MGNNKSAIDRLAFNADRFIKICNVMPVVYAKEGGIIELEKLLIDFVKYNQENAG